MATGKTGIVKALMKGHIIVFAHYLLNILIAHSSQLWHMFEKNNKQKMQWDMNYGLGGYRLFRRL